MQADDWAPEHCKALQDYLALGMSFAEIARTINATFGTRYSRNAAIGRSKRMKLSAPNRAANGNRAKPRRHFRSEATRLQPARPSPASSAGTLSSAASAAVRPEPIPLRCVGIRPRLLCLDELEAADCRYPYGGDREDDPIRFCGHPRLEGSSYCVPHAELTRGDDADIERAARPVALRLVRPA